MIRECKFEDLEQLIKMSSMEVIDHDLNNMMKIFRDSKNFLVWDELGVKGFAYVIIRNEEKREWDIQVYVDPRERRKGIGTLLHQEIYKIVESENPSILVTGVRVDKENPAAFYERYGYKKWFGSPSMCYTGGVQPEVDIEFIPYEDKFYEQYAECRTECFYEIAVKNDFKPYVIPLNEKDKKTLSNKPIYVTLHNDQLVGAVTVEDGYLDHIMVSPAYQGKGYGKKITQFGINKALSKGATSIQLCYIEGNSKAENLYKLLGFETFKIMHVYREFMD
ncbi:GNAT family N-acetyltransferase [Bacillus pseudomycoides]|uniref:GNAT family N-acetyltransferase n=1 Tax=Bacillus pseudomycoides TaxID=64104 RepID=UPI0023DB7100|nr:GNAT family N-acetyltransferase [Bacillus pseudomycoides]MDF2086262.1 GNAT family N-acetyltransferase [Bacillus pseudomycoides]